MDQKYITDSESLSLNIEATCLLHSSPRNFPNEIKMDKYRPYPSMISMFTSDSQHPPRSRHAVHLGVYCGWLIFSKSTVLRKILSGIPSECQADWVQIRPDILSGLIWVQTVCKVYQQTTFSRQRVSRTYIRPDFFIS